MKAKYCIHISGVDNLIPMHDMAEAVRASAYLNAEYLSVYQDNPSSNVTPMCFAVPRIWPYTDEAHAKALEECKRRATKEKAPHWTVD